MRVLLDTQALLWFLLDDQRLSPHAITVIANLDNEVLISPASYWEIAIKISIGKYSLPEPYAEFMERELAGNGFSILPIEVKHTAALINLPFHHRDPFDRIIIAQGIAEGIPIISIDAAFRAYPVPSIW